MKNPRSIGLRSGLPAPLLMLLMALLGGCAGNAAYHDGPPADCHNPDSSDVCARSYYQQHENFDLAFVEYSERGNAFSDERVKEVLARIESHATASGAVVVVFVHGWKHNASEDDQNLLDFKRTLSILKGTGAVRDRAVGELAGARQFLQLRIGSREIGGQQQGREGAQQEGRDAESWEQGFHGLTDQRRVTGRG